MAANQNMKFDESGILWGFLLIVGGDKLSNIEDSSLVTLGNQLLSLATRKLMDDNKEFDDSVTFWGALFTDWGKELVHMNH